jgi:AraC family transcriptional regulator, transcriptional activator FtrA
VAEVAERNRIRVCVLAFPGVDELDLFGAYVPVAKAAAQDDTGLQVRIVSADERVVGANGAEVLAHAGLDWAEDAHALVVPGGSGVALVGEDDRYVDLLSEAYRRGVRLYAVCSGVFLLAAAGIVVGRWVAVHHGKRHQLTEVADCHVTAGIVRDPPVCSIGGETTRGVKGVDLGFQLLRDLVPAAVPYVTDRMETRPGPRALERIG